MTTEGGTSFEHLVAEAERQDFCGWDFSFIEGRWRESPASWDYRNGKAVMLPEMESDPAARQSAACMVSEAVCFAMTLMWRGRHAEGLRIIEAIWKAHAITHRTPFDQYFMIDPADGAPIWGNDYYSNMITWAVPMALAGQDIAAYATGPLISGCLDARSRANHPTRD